MDKRWQWLRSQVRDSLELFIVPSLAVVLPWPLCFWVFKQLAKSSKLYRYATESGWHQAKLYLPELLDEQWKCERRLLTMVDHADLFLSCTRPDTWIKRRIDVTGNWPSALESNVVCTFHWGAGMFSLHAMRHAGLQVHALAASLDSSQFKGRPVLHQYAKWRTFRVKQLLGHPTVDVKASMRPVLKAIQKQHSLLAVVDVPSDHREVSVSLKLLSQHIKVPRGLLRLAADRKLPVSVFLLGLNLQTGQRELKIQSLGVMGDTQQLADNVFEYLDDAVNQAPSAWHLWAEMPRFLNHNKN